MMENRAHTQRAFSSSEGQVVDQQGNRPGSINSREGSLPYRLFCWAGPNYVLLMVLFTRLFAAVFGSFCVMYVNHTMGLQGDIRWKFTVISTACIAAAVLLTLYSAVCQTRTLRALLVSLRDGTPRTAAVERTGVWEALVFPSRNTLIELVLDPLVTVAPICLMLLMSGVSSTVAMQTCIAGFMGISCFLMTTFLIAESWLRPVVQHFIAAGIPVDFEELPQESLRRRMQIGFGTTILVTATMIGGLAYRRTEEIVRRPSLQPDAARRLTEQIVVITLLSLVVGLSYSRAIAQSVTGRVAELIAAMKRVQQGELTYKIQPNGTDEIDVLTRQFNRMVDELARKEHQVQQLTTGLETTVAERTQQLTSTVEQLRTMQQQLVHSEKMTSLGQLVAGLAHEINNAINAVYNGTPAVVKRLKAIEANLSADLKIPTPPAELVKGIQKIYRLLEVIEDGASRTARIVQDMKTFSHPSSGGLIDFDVNRTLEMCLNLLRLPRPGVIEIHRQLGDVPRLRGPFGHLDQVFLNLLNNAIDAMPGGGTITLISHCSEQDFQVSICDTGHGIPSKYRQQIFDPFFTTKPPGKGTGLGLSISYGIIRTLGGTIEPFSTEGIGTEFRIILPRKPGDPRLDDVNPAVQRTNSIVPVTSSPVLLVHDRTHLT